MTCKAAIAELLDIAITALEAVRELETQPDEVELMEDVGAQITDAHVDLTDLCATFAHAPEDTWLALAEVFEEDK